VRSDSAFLLQRLEKVLYHAALDSIRNRFPTVRLSDVADLFLGRWPKGFSSLNWNWNPSTDQLRASYQQAQLQAQLLPAQARLSGWEMNLPTGSTLSLAYEWKEASIPASMTLTLPSGEKLLLALTDFGSNISDLSFAFVTPSDYDRKPFLLRSP
jgi:hypothetical protein